MLIELCGPDGSGKSTLIDILRGRMRQEGAVVYERTLRSESRNLLELARLSSGITFPARDIELVVVLDAVQQGAGELKKYQGAAHMHVFVQQWTHALAARLQAHGFGDDEGLQWLLALMPAPDLSLRLQLDPERCLARAKQRPKGDDLLRSPDSAGAVRRHAEGFDVSARRLPYIQVVLDALLPPEQLADKAWQHLNCALS